MNSETENTILDPTQYKPQKKAKVYKNENQSTDFQTTSKQHWAIEQNKSFVFGEEQIVNVYDVAAYILKKYKRMTTMKLHKLLYYCQAWSLVWDEQQLFSEEIEAWANGPVVRELFSFHRGQYIIEDINIGNPNLLKQKQIETVDAVLDYYGDKSAQWLIQLAHLEEPWKVAREGLSTSERGDRKISLESMANYYSSL